MHLNQNMKTPKGSKNQWWQTSRRRLEGVLSTEKNTKWVFFCRNFKVCMQTCLCEFLLMFLLAFTFCGVVSRVIKHQLNLRLQQILKHEEKMATMTKMQRQKLISMTLKKKHKLLEDLRQGLVEDTFASENYKEWINNKRTNNLEKIHFIIGHGILRKELRWVFAIPDKIENQFLLTKNKTGSGKRFIFTFDEIRESDFLGTKYIVRSASNWPPTPAKYLELAAGFSWLSASAVFLLLKDSSTISDPSSEMVQQVTAAFAMKNLNEPSKTVAELNHPVG